MNRPHRQSFDIDGVAHSVPIPMGTRVGNMLFSSGIMGIDPATGQLPTALADQVRCAFANMAALLDLAGSGPGDVAHVRVLVAEEDYRSAVNSEWVAYFPDPDSRPARHTVVSALRGGMLVQLEIVAVVK